MQRNRKLIWVTALTIGAFAVQAIGYATTELAGDYAFLASVVMIVAAAGFIGALIGRRLTLLAVLAGAGVGAAYWFVDWQFLQFLRVDILHQFNDNNISWIASLYAVTLWPMIILCAIASGVGAVRTATTGEGQKSRQ